MTSVQQHLEGVSSSPRTPYRVTLAVLTLAATSYALLQSLVLPTLPELQRSLHVSEATVSWILTAYLLSASVATPIIGRLGDMYGKERVLVIVLAMLAVGTLISALASSIAPMLLGRVIQGAGGGIFPLGFGIIRDEFPPREVARGIGLMSSLIGVGGGAGVVLAGLIVERVSYHWLFWVPLMFILPAAIAAHVFVPESPVKVPGRVNWPAAALMSAGLTALLVGVTETTQWGWTSPKTLTTIALGLGLLAWWIAREATARVPLVDMRIMRQRAVWTTNLVAFLIGVGMYSSFLLIPAFVQAPRSSGYGFGASVLGSGIYLAPCTITMLLVGQFTGVLDRRIGSRASLILGTGCCLVAYAILASTPQFAGLVYLSSAILGAGIGLAFAALANVIVQNVRQDQTGVATGMNTVMRTLGGALGGQIVASLLARDIGPAGLPTADAFALAFGLCAAVLVVGIAAGLLIPSRARRAMGPIASARVAVEAADV
jgi:EmrB/QacA subfamily drug resistance transporter